jgi:4-aminobutyrate aminotransferase / (S)-3-amino-2-methylpropionate transaminase / 5-aminovalerate transaminase
MAGTTNASLHERRTAAVPRGVANACAIYADRAENAEIWDVEGRRYIDFAGGIAVLNTGHRHPKVMAAAGAQEERFTHTSFQVVPYESYIALAERLNGLAPGDFAKKTIFLTTGAEAIENAVKIARAATGRPGVIAFTGGYHGRTLMTLGLTGKVSPYKTKFGPFPPDIFRAPFPNEMHGITVEDALAALDLLFRTDAEPERVAAMVVEPVQGEGGYYVAPFEFLRELRRICDAHGILLISDEIQSGFGRTGRWFAIEHSGVAPDLIAVAKSLAGGFPLSGVIGRAEVMDSVPPGGLGGTYGGNPVACAAAVAAIQAIEDEGLLRRSLELGERLTARLREMAESNWLPYVGEVRGLGGMVAVEFVRERGSRAPNPELTKELTARAATNGLILLSCGLYGNVVRIMVPLTASDAIVDEGLDIMERSLREVVGAT